MNLNRGEGRGGDTRNFSKVKKLRYIKKFLVVLLLHYLGKAVFFLYYLYRVKNFISHNSSIFDNPIEYFWNEK